MNRWFIRKFFQTSLFVLCLNVAALSAIAQNNSTDKKDGWIFGRDESMGLTVQTREMVLYPKSQPRPALRYRLIPDEFDMVEGNAAIYYLKAQGFLEQDPARDRLGQVRKEARDRAQREDKGLGDVPPHVWRTTPPDQLPLEEVKEYLRLTSFQPMFIREGARRRRYDLDRHFREIDDPIAYLLPEVQSIRELARTQSLRCRLAMAEGRIDDAIAIIGQQFCMARHLGQDDFLVTNLVGIAIATIGWNDLLYLVQYPDTPNLYWALATMPRPLVNTSHAMATERQFLYQQLKPLREVDETLRPAGYWRVFLDRVGPGLSQLLSFEAGYRSFEDDPKLGRAALVGYISAAYPGARDYLLQKCHMPPEQVEAYPTAQVVFLAMVRFYDYWRDETFKWNHLPFWQTQADAQQKAIETEMGRESGRYGWCTLPTNLFLPAIRAVGFAEARCDQAIALVQTVEAIRMYGADHDGMLPTSLEQLSVPAPIEPFTGRPIDYELFGDRAVLSGHTLPGLRYRLVLRFSKQAE